MGTGSFPCFSNLYIRSLISIFLFIFACNLTAAQHAPLRDTHFDSRSPIHVLLQARRSQAASQPPPPLSSRFARKVKAILTTPDPSDSDDSSRIPLTDEVLGAEAWLRDPLFPSASAGLLRTSAEERRLAESADESGGGGRRGGCEPLPHHIRTITIVAAVLLACGSAVFSGLTLGLMTLDVVQLRILMDTARAERERGVAPADALVALKQQKILRDARRASRIYRLRKDGNLLLVTLLVCNVAVNSGFSIITSDLTSGIVGFLISTSIITLLGEIIPQAIFTRYSLIIGYYMAPLVWFCEIVLYLIVKPIALMLDWCIGKDLGVNYSREQLKALLGHHEKEMKVLRQDEAQILFGGLDMANKTAASAMTPVDQVYAIDVRGDLDFDTAAAMVSSGYSRIPVVDRSNNSNQCVVGLLYTKDIALIDPSLKLPVRSVLSMFGRPVYGVDVDTDLLSILTEFKKGQSHLAVVREVVSDGMRDPYYRHVGILTLEDVIEEILQDEIFDEYENAQSNQRGKLATTSQQSTPSAPVPTPDSSRRPRRRWDFLRLHLKRKEKQLDSAPSTFDSDSHMPPATMTSPAMPIEPSEPPWQLLTAGVSHHPPPPHSPSSGIKIPFQSAPSIRRRTNSLDNPFAPPLTPAAANFLSDSLPTKKEFASPQSAGVASAATGIEVMNSASRIQHQWGTPNLETPSAHRHLSAPERDSSVRNAMLGRLKLFDRRRKLEPLSHNEAVAVSLFLAASEPPFQPPYITTSALERLLRQCPVLQQQSDASPSPPPIFVKNSPADFFVLVLQGFIHVVAGADAIECNIGPWHGLGSKALGPPNLKELKQSLNLSEPPEVIASDVDTWLQQWEASHVYTPDFSAYPVEVSSTVTPAQKGSTPNLRYIKIPKKVYLQAIRGKLY